jgi:GNAT superfamily N-acetyltransferase
MMRGVTDVSDVASDVVPVPAALRAHWQAWTGAAAEQVDVLGTDGAPRIMVVGSVRREQPGWDGAVHAVTGVVDATGHALVSVPPRLVEWARDRVSGGADVASLRRELPAALDAPGSVVYQGVLRWALDVPGPDVLQPAGEWLPAEHPAVPSWLHPFGGHVLVVLEDGQYVAGLGLKHHDGRGREISVGTEEAARGRGLARRLVATAARQLLSEGVVPTYLHDPRNTASGKVADAAGFPDRGWTVLGIAGPVEVAEASGTG